MSELDAVIRDLRTAAAAINDAADTLTEMFSGETAEAPATPTEPVPTKERRYHKLIIFASYLICILMRRKSQNIFGITTCIPVIWQYAYFA